jgi:hypothetical protein
MRKYVVIRIRVVEPRTLPAGWTLAYDYLAQKILYKISYKDYNLCIFAKDDPFNGNFENDCTESLIGSTF